LLVSNKSLLFTLNEIVLYSFILANQITFERTVNSAITDDQNFLATCAKLHKIPLLQETGGSKISENKQPNDN